MAVEPFLIRPERFLTESLRALPEGEAVTRVLAAALDAVDPYRAVKRFLCREEGLLQVGGQVYELARFKRIWLVGAGKAGYPMARAALEVLGNRVYAGLVIVKDGYAGEAPLAPVEICQAGHPLPDARGAEATRRMMELLRTVGADDLVICLISGGGSALMTAPADGIGLDDLQQMTTLLLACGASINEINALRKHMDLVKGGGLARLAASAAPATLITLVLSDVIGDPLDVIASGPTVPDPSSFQDAWAVLQSYALTERIPASIRARLQAGLRGEIEETPKPGDALFECVQTLVISSNDQAAQAALLQAQVEGWHALLLTTFLQGEARQAGRMLAALARQVAAERGQPLARPACLVMGGETTVTLNNPVSGKGGRNQELALGAVMDLAGLSAVTLVALATDGGDGPTDAAGAVVTGATHARALQAGLRETDYLARNDAYHFFEPLNDLLRTGPTQTNVNDLAFLFVL